MEYNKPVMLDFTGQQIVASLNNISNKLKLSDSECYWKLNYHNNSGTSILKTEFIKNGEDGTWDNSDWTTTPNGTVVVPDAIEDISTNTDVYAIWKGIFDFDVTDPIYSYVYRGNGYSGPNTTQTYTATGNRNLLAIGIFTGGIPERPTSNSLNITSTGTITDTFTDNKQTNNVVDYRILMKEITTEENDTITFTVSADGGYQQYSSASFFIFEKQADISLLYSLKDNQSYGQMQGSGSLNKSYTVTEDGVYLLINNLYASGAGSTDTHTTSISVNGSAIQDNVFSKYISGSCYADLAVIDCKKNDVISYGGSYSFIANEFGSAVILAIRVL